MKRLGGIITVLLVVFCAGAVISCAGTKNAIVKDSNKENNTSKKSAENQAESLSTPLEESNQPDNTTDSVKNDELTQGLNQTQPEAFLETETLTAQLFDIPGVLFQEEIAEEESEIETVINQEEFAHGENISGNGGSVLFTLKRAEEIKNGESVENEIAEADISNVERPTLTVLEERLLGYNGKSNFADETVKVEPSVSTFENYETELAVLPAISVEPIKPEATIQENAYLAQIISLPKIAEETVGEIAKEEKLSEEETVADIEIAEVSDDENMLLSEPKPLEIALGNSVTPFGLPGSFLSPLANPDTVVKSMNDRTENVEAEQPVEEKVVSDVAEMKTSKKEEKSAGTKNVQIKDVKTQQYVEIQQKPILSTESVPEVAFAAKKTEEQNVALNEMLSVNKIEMPVVKNTPVAVENKAKEIKTAVAYVEVGEPEELEEVADFEMKPDFVFPQENVSCLENQETIIKMQGTGWRIEEMNRQVMELLERKIGKDNSTTFKIKNGNAGMQQIKFTRYNEDENRQEIQVYNVEIKPVLLTAENDKKKAPKAKKASKSKGADDYRRTLADHLYADENFAQASVYYKKLIDENIVDSELLYKAAHSMKEAGNTKNAMEYYQKNLAEEGNPFYDDAIIEYIHLLKEQKEFDKAINVVYERGLSKSVSEDCTQKLYRTLGDLFFNVKNYTEAIRTYKTVLSLYPAGNGEDKAMFYLAYALELQENPEFKEAQRFYRELLDVYPESQYVNLSRSRIGFIDRHYIKVN